VIRNGGALAVCNNAGRGLDPLVPPGASGSYAADEDQDSSALGRAVVLSRNRGAVRRRTADSTLISMTDFYAPVRIPREMFDLLISRVDQAVGEHAVALLLNEDFPFRALDPISPTAIDLSGVILDDDPLDIIHYLDQLLYFAFEGVPNDIRRVLG